MSQLTGVKLNKLEGGLGREDASTDSYFGLVAKMPLTGLTGLTLNQATVLIQIEDAELLGIKPDYDANNNVLIHHHVSEFFRIAPNGTLFLIPVSTTEIIATIPEVMPTIRENKEIKGLGFAGFSNTLDSLPTEIETIQTDLITLLASENRFIDFVLLEGLKGASMINPTSLTDLREKNAPQISVLVSQDPKITTDSGITNYASIGSALGGLAVRKVNENLGSVNIQNKPDSKKATRDYPLTDTAKGLFLDASLTDGVRIGTLSKTSLKALNNKGYIFISSYEGYGGFFFSNSVTAVSKSSDFGNIENNRVWNKAARIIRQTLIPEVKGIVKKDPQTGFIKSTTISRWKSLLDSALEKMIIADEISGFDIFIDNKQIVVDETPVKIKAKIVMDGIVHEFEVDLGLNKNI